VVPDDPEAFLRAMLVPLKAARRGEPLPGVPFSREAVANAFVMLGLLPSARAEDILAEYRPELEAKGFRMGVLTGELSVRMDLYLTWATLTPNGMWLRLSATGSAEDEGRPSRPPRRALPFQRVVQAIQSGLSVTDDLGQAYRLRAIRGGGTVIAERRGPAEYRWRGEMMAEPEHRPAESDFGRTALWLEFATASGPAARVDLRPPAQVATGEAVPPWPTPAECYLAVLGAAVSMTIATDGGTVELDTARITAAVADALLWVGALPPDSALLSARTAAGAEGWREELKYLWGRQARQRTREAEAERAGLAVRLPLRRATAVLEGIAARDGLVSVELYGHPWVTGEYWPMIAPCFQVRAIDDTGIEHEGVPAGGGGSPEGSWEFWFWPPVDQVARRLRVIVSTLWEAGWAEVDIPGRPVR
jgi:hypothetical protein